MSSRTAPMMEFRASRPQTKAGLVLLYGPTPQALPVYTLSDCVIVGREAPAGICLNDPAVSKSHAQISNQGRCWVLRDLQSRNGTLVDGRYVREVELENLQEIQLGHYIFKFVDAGAERFAQFYMNGAHPSRGRAPQLLGGASVDAIVRDLEESATLDLLVTGETGTGKELVARAAHQLGRGPSGAPFVPVNCAAIPKDLVESELFGHAKGAFSGATHAKEGLFRAADRGTLFLDEIGDMPLHAQSKLLRFLQEREIRPVGTVNSETVDVRVVCATHRNLARMVKDQEFRADLLARIRQHTICLVPLRERKEDIASLVHCFLAKYGRADARLSFRFWAAICHYDWEFNVRELENAIRRAAQVPASELDVGHLPNHIQDAFAGYGANAASPVCGGSERSIPPSADDLRAALEQHRGNITSISKQFRKDRMQIRRWLKRYGIDPEAYR